MTWSMTPPAGPRRPMGPMRMIPYVVQPGDTLFVIGQKFKTTVDAIVGANCIADPDLIFPGQVLYIPCSAAPRAGAMTWGQMAAPAPMAGPRQDGE
ncbi:MAG: LysM peptidoglycan-binding domain-containing protein [Symbiobacteriia bacterium]